MRRLTSYQIALSALSCAIATVFLTVGVYSSLLLFTGYLFASVALMLPLSKQSYVGYALSYIATCILGFIFNAGRFFDLLPFVVFFGVHPLINELQLKTKINRWVACGVKAVWFDATMYLLWRWVFGGVSGFPFVDRYVLLFILVLGSAFFVFYDYAAYKARGAVNTLVARITKNK